jgi:hypothetical protein
MMGRLEEILSPYGGGNDFCVVLSHLGEGGDDGRKISGPDLTRVPNASAVIDGHSHKVRLRETEGAPPYINLGQALEAVAEIRLGGDRTPNRPFVRVLSHSDLVRHPEDPEISEAVDRLLARLGLEEVLTEFPEGAFLRWGQGQGLDRSLGAAVGMTLARKAGADFCVLNPGAVRAGLDGRVTKAHALEVLPFRDRLFSAEYSGKEILDYFRSLAFIGVSHLPYFYGLSIFASRRGPGRIPQDDGPSPEHGGGSLGENRGEGDPPKSDRNGDDRGQERFRIDRMETLNGETIRHGSLYTLATSAQMSRIMGDRGPHQNRRGHKDHGTVSDAFMEGLKAIPAMKIMDVCHRQSIFIE